MSGGVYTVGEIAAFGARAGETHLIIACNRCDRRGRLSLARLVAEYGRTSRGRNCCANCRLIARSGRARRFTNDAESIIRKCRDGSALLFQTGR
jgi:hypothetical protein